MHRESGSFCRERETRSRSSFEKLKELTQAFARVGGHAQMDLVYTDMDVEECLGTKNCEAFQQFTVGFRYFL